MRHPYGFGDDPDADPHDWHGDGRWDDDPSPYDGTYAEE